MSRAEEASNAAYPNYWKSYPFETNKEARAAFIKGYEQAEKDIIEHCEKRISEYNAQNLSNMFLRRAFEDVIRFIKEIPYNDYKDEDYE